MSDFQDNHLAVIANKNSIKFASEKNKEAWLALYRDDAVVCDPVGVSPFDEKGDGHIGKAAIENFWDTVIASSNIQITAHKRCPSGTHSCAVHQSAVNDMGNGIKTTIEMIAVYHVDDEGLIKSMQAYWSWDEMQEQLKQLGLG